MNGLPTDGMPVMEWAYWWDKTLDIWHEQGLPKGLNEDQMQDYFHLAHHRQFWLAHKAAGCPADTSHGSGIIMDEDDYDAIRKYLLPQDAVPRLVPQLRALRSRHENGELLIWYTLDGFFWWPRVLFGIENHFYSFYDYPELYHRICDELSTWQIRMAPCFPKNCLTSFFFLITIVWYRKSKNMAPMYLSTQTAISPVRFPGLLKPVLTEFSP